MAGRSEAPWGRMMCLETSEVHNLTDKPLAREATLVKIVSLTSRIFVNPGQDPSGLSQMTDHFAIKIGAEGKLSHGDTIGLQTAGEDSSSSPSHLAMFTLFLGAGDDDEEEEEGEEGDDDRACNIAGASASPRDHLSASQGAQDIAGGERGGSRPMSKRKASARGEAEREGGKAAHKCKEAAPGAGRMAGKAKVGMVGAGGGGRKAMSQRSQRSQRPTKAVPVPLEFVKVAARSASSAPPAAGGGGGGAGQTQQQSAGGGGASCGETRVESISEAVSPQLVREASQGAEAEEDAIREFPETVKRRRTSRATPSNSGEGGCGDTQDQGAARSSGKASLRESQAGGEAALRFGDRKRDVRGNQKPSSVVDVEKRSQREEKDDEGPSAHRDDEEEDIARSSLPQETPRGNQQESRRHILVPETPAVGGVDLGPSSQGQVDMLRERLQALRGEAEEWRTRQEKALEDQKESDRAIEEAQQALDEAPGKLKAAKEGYRKQNVMFKRKQAQEDELDRQLNLAKDKHNNILQEQDAERKRKGAVEEANGKVTAMRKEAIDAKQERERLEKGHKEDLERLKKAKNSITALEVETCQVAGQKKEAEDVEAEERINHAAWMERERKAIAAMDKEECEKKETKAEKQEENRATIDQLNSAHSNLDEVKQKCRDSQVQAEASEARVRSLERDLEDTKNAKLRQEDALRKIQEDCMAADDQERQANEKAEEYEKDAAEAVEKKQSLESQIQLDENEEKALMDSMRALAARVRGCEKEANGLRSIVDPLNVGLKGRVCADLHRTSRDQGREGAGGAGEVIQLD